MIRHPLVTCLWVLCLILFQGAAYAQTSRWRRLVAHTDIAVRADDVREQVVEIRKQPFDEATLREASLFTITFDRSDTSVRVGLFYA